MSHNLDERVRNLGTRFLLYAQPPLLEAFSEPEIVWVSPTAGTLKSGPEDDRMFVVRAENKRRYGETEGPPYTGKCLPPARPDADGHFSHILPDDPTFQAAHMYGTVRRVLDVWEDYCCGPLPWHFQNFYRRLEMIPYVKWKNAQFGAGFMELGYETDDQGKSWPFYLNFDVMAHELGHGLVFSMVGIPNMDSLTTEFRGFHESSSDLVALIAVLHFNKFIDYLLNKTSGNIYVENELSRIGELSETRQIRDASNNLRMSDVVDVSLSPLIVTGKEVHKLGQPLTGAVFDFLAAVYLQNLVDRTLISAELAEESKFEFERELETSRLSKAFKDAYDREPDGFRMALIDARDCVGKRLAYTWHTLSPHNLQYSTVAATFLTADRALGDGRYQDEIIDCFRWREIGPGFRQLPNRPREMRTEH